MMKTITTGTLALVIALAGCASTEKYGDAMVVMKRNLMKSMTYSLNSPTFSIGEKKEYLFEYRALPQPVFPDKIIAVRYQWPNPDKGKETPSYIGTQCRISFEDADGKAFFTTNVVLNALGTTLYGPDKAPDAKATYNVRVTILEPSSRRKDKAYLHRFSIGSLN